MYFQGRRKRFHFSFPHMEEYGHILHEEKDLKEKGYFLSHAEVFIFYSFRFSSIFMGVVLDFILNITIRL